MKCRWRRRWRRLARPRWGFCIWVRRVRAFRCKRAPSRDAHPGFYIYSCPKMRYKGEYAPSFLADPEEHTWHPLERCTPLLEKNRYACFAHPERSLVGACDARTCYCVVWAESTC